MWNSLLSATNKIEHHFTTFTGYFNQKLSYPLTITLSKNDSWKSKSKTTPLKTPASPLFLRNLLVILQNFKVEVIDFSLSVARILEQFQLIVELKTYCGDFCPAHLPLWSWKQIADRFVLYSPRITALRRRDRSCNQFLEPNCPSVSETIFPHRILSVGCPQIPHCTLRIDLIRRSSIRILDRLSVSLTTLRTVFG